MRWTVSSILLSNKKKKKKIILQRHLAELEKPRQTTNSQANSLLLDNIPCKYGMAFTEMNKLCPVSQSSLVNTNFQLSNQISGWQPKPRPVDETGFSLVELWRQLYRAVLYHATIFCRVASYRQFNRAPSGRLDHFHSDEIWRRDRELAAYILAFSRRYVVLITYLTR